MTEISNERLDEMLTWCAELKASKPWCGEGDESPKMLTTVDFMTSLITELRERRASPSGVAVSVAPLKWGKTSYGRPEVETVVGFYRVFEHMDGGWGATFRSINLTDPHGRRNFATEAEALAAAEADYRTRIMSCLTSPVPTGEAEPVAWDELARDQSRGKAAKLLEAKGWKPGDSFSITAMLALMVEFAEQAHTITDRCGFPDCGCDFDAQCTQPAITPPAPNGVAVDRLAEIIRTVDGDHSLGAGALAERILAALEGGSQ